MIKIERQTKKVTEPPTTSLPDIVFLLLLFYMVTSTFRQFTGLPVNLPIAKKTEKLETKKNVTNIWANSQGEICIDDKMVQLADISQIVYQKRVENPKLIVSMKIDRYAGMGILTDIHEKLRDADALKVNYCAKFGD